jgi:uncharacterized membrane protein
LSARLRERIRRRPALLGAIAIAAGYFLLVGFLTRLEYGCFFYGFDLAWYGNLLAAGHGKWPLYSSLHASWLGDHFEPIALLLVPLFRVVPSVWILLVTQNLLFASVPLLVFLLAAEVLGDDRQALLAALLAVANPALWYINLDDFHWTVVTIPLTIAYFLALERRRPRWALAALAAMLLCKEDAALLVVPLCLAYLATFGVKRPALVFAGAATTLFVLVNVCLMPALGSAAPTGGWSYLGGSVGGIAARLLRHPGVVARQLAEPDVREYLLEILLPVGFLSVLDWRLWLAAPVALTFALSTHLPRHTIASQSAAMVVPCVIVSALYGIRRAAAWVARPERAARARVVVLVLVLLLAVAFFGRPLPAAVAERPYVRLLRGGPSLWTSAQLCPERTRLEALLHLVPDDPGVAVLAEVRLAPRLVHHPWLQVYNWKRRPMSDDRAFDVIVGSRPTTGDDDAEHPRTRRRRKRDQRRDARFTAFASDPRWEQVYSDADGYFVLRNRQPEHELRNLSPRAMPDATPR